MLDALGIREIKSKQYCQLSTGQKRRLHLMLALTGNPDIVFLDEPTAGLDVSGRLELHKQIRNLRSLGKTIILASHDMAEVETLCDRIAILQAGDRTLKTDNITDTLLSLLGELKQKGIKVTDIKVDRGTLEQHFLEIAGRKRK